MDNQIYIENKYDLEKYDPNYINWWKFFIPKTVCRGCFLQIINAEHLFANLKTIFTYIVPNIISKILSRNRTLFNSRARYIHSVKRNTISRNFDTNENGENSKNKIIISEKEDNGYKIKITNIFQKIIIIYQIMIKID